MGLFTEEQLQQAYEASKMPFRRAASTPKPAPWKPVSGAVVPAVEGIAEIAVSPFALGQMAGKALALPTEGEAQAQADYTRLFGRPPVDVSPEAIAEAEKPYYHPFEPPVSAVESFLDDITTAPSKLARFLRQLMGAGEPTTFGEQAYEDLFRTLSQVFALRGIGLPGAQTAIGEAGLGTLSSVLGATAAEFDEIPELEALARVVPYLVAPIRALLATPGTRNVGRAVAEAAKQAEVQLGRELTQQELAALQQMIEAEAQQLLRAEELAGAELGVEAARDELAAARMATADIEGFQAIGTAGQTTEEAVRALEAAGTKSQALKILEDNQQAAGAAEVDAIKKRLKLQSLPGQKALPTEKTAQQVRKQVQQARTKQAKVFTERYRDWDSKYGQLSGIVDASELGDLLDLGTGIVKDIRASVAQSTSDTVRQALGELADDLASKLASVAEGGGALNVQVSDLRNIQKAINERMKFSVPGDKVRMLEGLNIAVDDLLRSLVGEEGHAELLKLSADYRQFKSVFDNNPVIRPFLADWKSASDALKRINDAGDMTALLKATNPATAELVSKYHLQDILKGTPEQALTALEKMGHVGAGMKAAEYERLLRDLRSAQNVVETRGLIRAADDFAKIASDSKHTFTVRQRALEAVNEIEAQLLQLPEAKGAVKRLQEARRKYAEAQAKFEQVQKRAVSTAVKQDRPTAIKHFLDKEKPTYSMVSKMLDEAQSLGGSAPSLVADAVVDHYLGKAFDNPYKLSQALLDHQEILTKVMPLSSIEQIRALADRMPDIIQKVNAMGPKAIERFTKDLPSMYKGKGIYGWLRRVALEKLTYATKAGLPVTRLIEDILSGNASRMGRAFDAIAQFKIGMPRPILQGYEEEAKPTPTATSRPSQQVRPRTKSTLFSDEQLKAALDASKQALKR